MKNTEKSIRFLDDYSILGFERVALNHRVFDGSVNLKNIIKTVDCSR